MSGTLPSEVRGLGRDFLPLFPVLWGNLGRYFLPLIPVLWGNLGRDFLPLIPVLWGNLEIGGDQLPPPFH